MRLLILGGDGYLGWPTAMHFSARGHDVHVVDNYLRRRAHEEAGTDSLTPLPESLPARAEGKVRGDVWNLSRHSAGMLVRFETDSPTIRARYALLHAGLAMPHMPATGVSGLDLYARDERGRDRWLGVAVPDRGSSGAHGPALCRSARGHERPRRDDEPTDDRQLRAVCRRFSHPSLNISLPGAGKSPGLRLFDSTDVWSGPCLGTFEQLVGCPGRVTADRMATEASLAAGVTRRRID